MHTPLHSSCGAGGGDTGTWQDAKQSSYLHTSSPGTGSRVLGLGRTKDGSLLYNFLAGPSASTNSSSCTDTWSHSLPGQQQQHEEAS